MLNVSALKATKTVMPARQGSRTARDLGPNPWLDKAWPYNLQASYDNAEPYQLTVPGAIVRDPAKRGEHKGELIDRLTGDAADAVTLIRDAANKLGLGAAIKYYADRAPGAKEGTTVVVPKGQVLIKYQGQKRKAARKPKPAVSPAATGNGSFTV